MKKLNPKAGFDFDLLPQQFTLKIMKKNWGSDSVKMGVWYPQRGTLLKKFSFLPHKTFFFDYTTYHKWLIKLKVS